MNIYKILAILKKDFKDGLKNYHIILMVLTPVILSLLLSKLVNTSASQEAALPEFGFISSPQQPFIEKLIKKGMQNKITFFQDLDSLEVALLEGKIKFGVILPEIITDKSNSEKTVTLLYPPSIPDFAAETLRASIETMFREQLGITPAPLPFNLEVKSIANPRGKGGITDNMFPMLILMAIGVIGFLALPMSIVEEREKGTLNAIFLTPIKPSEFIIGKSLFSFFLIGITIGLILTLNGKWNSNSPQLYLISMLGASMTIFIGLIIANFAQSQGSVNSIGTIIFLIFQMVPTLQSTSSSLDAISHFVPSTYIFSGVKKTLYLDLSKVSIQFDLTCVLTFAIAFYTITYLIYKFKKAD